MKTILRLHKRTFRKYPREIDGIEFMLIGFPEGSHHPARTYERQAIIIHDDMTKAELVSALRKLADSFETGEGLRIGTEEILSGHEINRADLPKEIDEAIEKARDEEFEAYNGKPRAKPPTP